MKLILDFKKWKYMNKLEKYTIGKSPAALYLTDLINQTQNPKDINLIKFLTNFRAEFKQLLNCYNMQLLNGEYLANYCSLKRKDLDEQTKHLVEKNYTPLLVNLYKNICISELKKFIRPYSFETHFTQSAINRAKHLKKNSPNINTFHTYGQYKNLSYKVDATVNFLRNGKIDVILDKSQIKDVINDDTLTKKSKKRLSKKNINFNPQWY